MSESSSDVALRLAALSDLTEQQLEAAEATGPVLVLSGAGTGKTKTLTVAVIHRIQACAVSPSRILAVTFTNKAAGEMISRIRARLGRDAAPHCIGSPPVNCGSSRAGKKRNASMATYRAHLRASGATKPRPAVIVT